MKKNLFSQKIKYLYESLNIGEEAFVKLFWNGVKPSFSVRKKTVIGKWYEGDIVQAKAFYFDTYPISRLHTGGTLFFTKTAFLDESLDTFKERVDKYVAYTVKPENTFGYKYIYYYDINLKKVSFFKLYTIQEIDSNRFKIKITSPDLYKNNNIDDYHGELNIINNYYHISAKNSFEILTFYFMLNKGFKDNTTIYGLRLGISYEDGLPMSGKNILSKKILSKEEEKLFYLNANESDTLISDEANQDIYSSLQESHRERIQKKLSNLFLYISKTKEEF